VADDAISLRRLAACGEQAMTKIAKVDVVGVGLNATDTLIPVEHFPERGSKVEIRSA